MSVPMDIPHGKRVRVLVQGEWFRGSVVENVRDNDRMIVVRTDERVGDNLAFLGGHGVSVGHLSPTIQMERPRRGTGRKRQSASW